MHKCGYVKKKWHVCHPLFVAGNSQGNQDDRIIRRDREDIHPLKISCAAIGTAGIKKIELIENNRVIYTQRRWRSVSTEMAFCLSRPDVRYYWRYYYVRLTQTDGNMAWSSPIWFLLADSE